MKVARAESIEAQAVDMQGAKDCTVRWLVGEVDGAPTFAMRQFDVAPGGHTPRHSHPYEHEIYVLEGDGVAYEGDKARPLTKGDVIFVEPDEVHQFENTGDAVMKFLCLIPNSAAGKQVTVAPECGIDPRGE
ncbi:MAG: cupin domain-containing protein [Planctomycetales bacterium]|nr:cupin domain-containing protein [Planctomycetales bacterium]